MPEARAKSHWYCYNDSDTAIVFVHGLRSDSRNAWLGAKEDAFWPRLAARDYRLGKPAIFLASFFTGSEASDYDIPKAAANLFVDLTTNSGNAGHPPVTDKRNIMFVTHSLGGIMVRAVLSANPGVFEGKRIGLLLVASPSKGSTYASYLAPGLEKMVGQLSWDSDYLETLHNQFLRFKEEKKRYRITGRELYEHKFAVMDTESIWGWAPNWASRKFASPVVVKDSAVRNYFPDAAQIPESDHASIAKPDSMEHPSHQHLVSVYKAMLADPAPECEAPPHFEVSLDIKAAGEKKPVFIFARPFTKDTVIPERPPVPADPASGLHIYRPGPVPSFPCRGEAFKARFFRNEAATKGSHRSNISAKQTDFCFVRSNAAADAKRAKLKCTELKACEIDKAEAGMAVACASTGWRLPKFVNTAHAAETDGTTHWEVPSLETLKSMPDELRTGYAEFTVTGDGEAGLSEATHFTYALSVNGVPLHVDGLPPHSEAVLLAGDKKPRLNFALENLAFTGGSDGREKIDLEIVYYQGENLIHSTLLKRDYVSYRAAQKIRVVNALRDPSDALSNLGRHLITSDAYDWVGTYRPAKVQASFEVMLVPAANAGGAVAEKQAFDALAKEYAGKPVVGVIRPGRKENVTYGMIFAQQLETGQIKSLYTREEAADICRWVSEEPGLKSFMRRYAYLFEFPAEVFTGEKDRGVRRENCSAL
ncbi:MAG: esterase/lipase family protein [Hyphomicrobium sp.]